MKTTKFDVQNHLKTRKERIAYLEAVMEDGDPRLIAAALGAVALCARDRSEPGDDLQGAQARWESHARYARQEHEGAGRQAIGAGDIGRRWSADSSMSKMSSKR